MATNFMCAFRTRSILNICMYIRSAFLWGIKILLLHCSVSIPPPAPPPIKLLSKFIHYHSIQLRPGTHFYSLLRQEQLLFRLANMHICQNKKQRGSRISLDSSIRTPRESWLLSIFSIHSFLHFIIFFCL